MFVRPDQKHKLPPVVILVFFWIGHANSAINPCLYILLNDGYRKDFFALLRNLCGRGTNVVATINPPALIKLDAKTP